MRMPIRKPGKYTSLKQDPYITQGKYNKLKKNLDRLNNIEIPAAIKEVKEQAAFGDFSDNAAYSIAKGKLRGLNNRVLKIKNSLKSAIIINENPKNDIVRLGCTVTVESGGKSKTYQILGSAEIDITRGIISRSSPLGSMLLKKKKGDIFKIKINERDIEYKITGIN